MRVLFHTLLSPFSRKVRVALGEKGLDFDLMAEKVWEQREEFLALNPAGQVLVGDQIVSIPEVREIIVKRLADNSDLAIALRVSRKAPYRAMVDVFDQLKLAKAERISLVPVIEEGAPAP